MRLVLSAVAVASLCAAPVWAQSDNSKNTETHDTRPEPPMLGKHLAKGQQGQASGAASTQSNLVYHGGPVMTNGTVVRAIYWGSSWTTNNSKISGLATFYQGVGNSPYLKTTNEFSQTGGGVVSTGVSYMGSYVDTAGVGRRTPSTSAVLSEVCKALQSHSEAPVTNGYYPVYVDQKRGHAGYCAWHSWGSCGAVKIQFGFFFNLDGDPGCDPGDSATGNPQGLAALANVSGHELSEMVTDPRGDAWYDSSGAENSDKCAWTFGHNFVTFGAKSWKIQGNFSNLANIHGTGYTDISPSGVFEQGCIDDVSER
jgi:hypothetical protein